MSAVRLILNGEDVSAEVEPRRSLADFVRDDRHLTATHLGCEHGVCGACTVWVNGAPARSCIAFAVALEGADVRTLEGFADDPLMERIRAAFHECHALQCGFCTPGMLMTSRDIVSRFESLDEASVRRELSGNLCRCTGYEGIVNAVCRVMTEIPAHERMQRGKPGTARGPEQTVAVEQHAQDGDILLVKENAEESARKGWSQVKESFIVLAPPDKVWAMLADTESMASCIPGFTLSSLSESNVTGQMTASFGPIRTTFECAVLLQRGTQGMEGAVSGIGRDPRSGSRARGFIRYVLRTETTDSTRVDVALEFAVYGPLAQFSRSGLVRELARGLITDFGANITAMGSGKGRVKSGTSDLRIGGLLRAMLGRLLRKILGRSRP